MARMRAASTPRPARRAAATAPGRACRRRGPGDRAHRSGPRRSSCCCASARARSRRSDVEVTVPRHLSASKVVAFARDREAVRARPAPPDAGAACRRRPTGHRVPRLGGAALRPGRHGRPARPARQRRRGPRRRRRPAADEGALPRQRVGLPHPRGDRDRDRDDRGRHRRPRPDRRGLPPRRTAVSPSSTGRPGPSRRASRRGSGPCSWRPTGWRSRACAGSHPTQVDARVLLRRERRDRVAASCPTRPTSCACCRPCPTETAGARRWRPAGARRGSRGQRGCCSCGGCWTGIGWVRSSSCSSPGARSRSRSRHRGGASSPPPRSRSSRPRRQPCRARRPPCRARRPLQPARRAPRPSRAPSGRRQVSSRRPPRLAGRSIAVPARRAGLIVRRGWSGRSPGRRRTLSARALRRPGGPAPCSRRRAGRRSWAPARAPERPTPR